MRGTIHVDLARCIACKACEIACAIEHSTAKTLVGALSERPRPLSRVKVTPLGDGLAAPFQCRHCEDAPCMGACPEQAFGRGGEPQPSAAALMEPVLLGWEACQAQKKCLRACPFAAIRMTPDSRKAYKCDLCLNRLEAGVEPACTEACPTGALTFVAGAAPFTGRADRRFLVVHEGTEARYAIDPEACTACGRCRRSCPQQCIEGEKKVAHRIDPERCIRCGACFLACRFGAVRVTAPASVLTAASTPTSQGGE